MQVEGCWAESYTLFSFLYSVKPLDNYLLRVRKNSHGIVGWDLNGEEVVVLPPVKKRSRLLMNFSRI